MKGSVSRQQNSRSKWYYNTWLEKKSHITHRSNPHSAMSWLICILSTVGCQMWHHPCVFKKKEKAFYCTSVPLCASEPNMACYILQNGPGWWRAARTESAVMLESHCYQRDTHGPTDLGRSSARAFPPCVSPSRCFFSHIYCLKKGHRRGHRTLTVKWLHVLLLWGLSLRRDVLEGYASCIF